MPTSYTSNLRFALPATGELSGTWGTVVNDNITTMVEQAIAGMAAVTFGSDADLTLSTANGTTDQARCAILNVTSSVSLTATRNVIVPASTKVYIVRNGTTGSQSITVKTSAGTGVTIANGEKGFVYCDGTNVVSALPTGATGTVTSVALSGGTTGLTVSGSPVTSSGTITLAGTLIAGNGGTGQSSYTTGDLLYASSSSALSKLADVATGNALISGGVGTAPSWGQIGLTTHVTGTLPVANGGSGATTLTGILKGNGTSAFTAVTAPTGDIVGTTDTQTLSNKTAVAPVLLASTTATQDGVIVTGRAGGSSTYRVTIAPTTLSASRAVTLPDAAGVVVLDTATQTLTGKTLTDPAIVGAILEDIYTITDGAAFEIDPGNGTIQLITLGASRTPKGTNFAAGESVTLMVDDGTAYAITWTDTTFGTGGVKWVGGSAPTLATTGYTVIELWKVSTQVYGALVGSA